MEKPPTPESNPPVGGQGRDDPPPGSRGTRLRPARRGWYLLLLLPFAATLVPPFYAREQPAVGGWPFFYWWQFAWIVITAILVGVVYRITTVRVPADRTRAEPGSSQQDTRGHDSDGPGHAGGEEH